ncbi:solute carrier family 52, riboflavin transporter, member 3-like [Physella acuta]|uniref:solute carrier family 52, riboflavin transporter, member 3-like n=1 Tax=Physella acuta TaxID=109671 RepID=UPI0027DB501C|nr:solute carrier family 52, riboflavin transporter, member 3-like [Physella acuta]
MGKIVAEKERTKFGVHVLVVLFGITSWSIMNGLWVELPILVADLPEGWTLPSYLTIISQCGNLGPILFSLLVYLVPHRKFETPTSLLVNLALTLCAALYALFWNRTAVVAGSDHRPKEEGFTCTALNQQCRRSLISEFSHLHGLLPPVDEPHLPQPL